MADFAPNFTARYRVKYTTLGRQHSMLWRIARGVGSTGLALMVAKVGSVLNVLVPARYTDWLVVGAEYAPEDVDFFVPAAIPTVTTGTAPIPPNPVSQSTFAISMVGRSTAGQKARMFLFGTSFDPESLLAPGDNFRVSTVESPLVTSLVNSLNSGSPTIVGSDGMGVIWYSYINTKYNDHWIAKVRA